jgi:hypothetical protein
MTTRKGWPRCFLAEYRRFVGFSRLSIATGFSRWWMGTERIAEPASGVLPRKRDDYEKGLKPV